MLWRNRHGRYSRLLVHLGNFVAQTAACWFGVRRIRVRYVRCLSITGVFKS